MVTDHPKDNSAAQPTWMTLLVCTLPALFLTLGSLHGIIDFDDELRKSASRNFSWFDAVFNILASVFMPICAYASAYPAPTKRWEKIVIKAFTSRAFILYFAGSGLCYCAQAILHAPVHVLDDKGIRAISMALAMGIFRNRLRSRSYDEISLSRQPATES